MWSFDGMIPIVEGQTCIILSKQNCIVDFCLVLQEMCDKISIGLLASLIRFVSCEKSFLFHSSFQFSYLFVFWFWLFFSLFLLAEGLECPFFCPLHWSWFECPDVDDILVIRIQCVLKMISEQLAISSEPTNSVHLFVRVRPLLLLRRTAPEPPLGLSLGMRATGCFIKLRETTISKFRTQNDIPHLPDVRSLQIHEKHNFIKKKTKNKMSLLETMPGITE